MPFSKEQACPTAMSGIIGVALCFVIFLYGPADSFVVHVPENGRDQFAGCLVGFANGAAAVFAVDGVFRGKRLVDVAGNGSPGPFLRFGITFIPGSSHPVSVFSVDVAVFAQSFVDVAADIVPEKAQEFTHVQIWRIIHMRCPFEDVSGFHVFCRFTGILNGIPD